jgi:hypothetical protein
MESKITNAVLFMTAKDNCPLSITENEGFRYLMKIVAPRYKCPSRFTFTKLVEEKYQVLSALIRQKLGSVKYLAFTSDIWTEPMNMSGFIGITSHYVHKDQLESCTLGNEIV